MMLIALSKMGGSHYPMHQRQKPTNILIDTALIIFVVVLLGIGVNYFGISVSVAATLLIGVWVIDAFLKRTYGFDSDTIFADLTLTSFGYSVSYAIGLLSLSYSSNSSNLIIHAFTLTFLIFLTWVANISLCRVFRMRSNNNWIKPIAWLFSVLLGLLSVFIAFYPLFV